MNTYTGATAIRGGTLQIGNGGSTGSLSASSVISNSGVLAFSRNNTMTQGTDFSSGAISGTGSLVQLGPGNLILTNNNYTGATTVAGGGLYINGSNTTPSISVASGATLGGSGTASSAAVSVAQGGILDVSQNTGNTFVLGSLGFGGSATMNFSYANGAYAAKPAISVATLSTSTSPININVVNTPIGGSGTMELLKYTGTIGGSGSAAFQLASPVNVGRYTYGLTISSNILDLSYSGDYPYWTGSNSTAWDTTTLNWKLNSSNAPTQYVATGDNVVFDDRAGSGPKSVAINNGNVTPASVTFSNTAASYTLTGSNSIAGATALTINGAGTVTIANSNSYTGGTSVSSGILNLNAAQAIGSGPLAVSGGTLNANYAQSPGSVALSGGRLNLADSGALGSGPLTISGGSLDNTSGAAMTLAGNNAQTWSGRFTFLGSSPLNLGTGAVTLSAATTATVNASTLTAAARSPAAAP